MSAADELYPFSTQDGKAVPLDIILPLAAMKVDYVASAATSFTIPASCALASLYSSSGCFVRFGVTLPDPLVSGTEYGDTLFIPPYSTLTAKLVPGIAYIYPMVESDAGYLILQGLKKWAFMGLERQLSRI